MVSFFTAMLDGWNTFLEGLQSGIVVLNSADEVTASCSRR
jgi:hypothetical protein